MKKYYNKPNELLTGNISYEDESIISANDIVNTYLIGYKNEVENRNIYSITDILHHYLGENLSGNLEWNDKKQTIAIIKDENENIILTLVFACNKPENPELIDVIDETNSYRLGDIELFKGVLTSYIKSYARNNIDTDKKYDRAHNGLYAVNCNFYLYLVANEAILFPGNVSYMDMTLTEEGLIKYDCKNMDSKEYFGIIGNEEKLLKNVYFNITDAPAFIQEELYRIRKKEVTELKNNNIKNGSFSRIRKMLKK